MDAQTVSATGCLRCAALSLRTNRRLLPNFWRWPDKASVGERPLRRVVGPVFTEGVAEYNQTYERLRAHMEEVLRRPDQAITWTRMLLVLPETPSGAPKTRTTRSPGDARPMPMRSAVQ